MNDTECIECKKNHATPIDIIEIQLCEKCKTLDKYALIEKSLIKNKFQLTIKDINIAINNGNIKSFKSDKKIYYYEKEIEKLHQEKLTQLLLKKEANENKKLELKKTNAQKRAAIKLAKEEVTLLKLELLDEKLSKAGLHRSDLHKKILKNYLDGGRKVYTMIKHAMKEKEFYDIIDKYESENKNIYLQPIYYNETAYITGKLTSKQLVEECENYKWMSTFKSKCENIHIFIEEWIKLKSPDPQPPIHLNDMIMTVVYRYIDKLLNNESLLPVDKLKLTDKFMVCITQENVKGYIDMLYDKNSNILGKISYDDYVIYISEKIDTIIAKVIWNDIIYYINLTPLEAYMAQKINIAKWDSYYDVNRIKNYKYNMNDVKNNIISRLNIFIEFQKCNKENKNIRNNRYIWRHKGY